MERLRKILNVKPDETAPVLILASYYFFIMATYLVSRSARDSFFLSRFDREDLPRVMVLVPIATIITVTLYNRLSQRIGITKLIMGSGVVFAISLVLIQVALNDALVVFLYVWADVIGTVIFFQFWLLAGMVFTSRQAKHLFGLLGVGGALGSILVGFALAPFVKSFGENALLLLAAGFMLAWVWMAWLARPYIHHAPKKASVGDDEQAAPQVFDAYIRTITLMIGIMLVMAVFVDYQFKVISREAYAGDPADLAGFFGVFYGAVGLISLGMRLFVERRILGTFGILVGLLILPITVGVGSLAIIITPVLFSAILTKGADQVFRYTINETSAELLWIPIEPARKVKAKPVVSGIIAPILQVASALILLVGAEVIKVEHISLIVLALIAIWIPILFRLRKGYLEQLLASIENHHLQFEDLTIDVSDPVMVDTIRKILQSDDEVEVAFGLELIQDMNLAPWQAELHYQLEQGSVPIQEKILNMAIDYPKIITDENVLSIVQRESYITDEAIIIATRRKLTEVIPILERYLRHAESDTIRAAAAKGILWMRQGNVEEARQTFERMLGARDSQQNLLALNMLVDMPSEFPPTLMQQYLERSTVNILSLSLHVMSQIKDVNDARSISDVAHTLRKARTVATARKVLKDYPPQDVIRVLITIFRDENTSFPLRIGIAQALQDYPTPEVINFLREALQEIGSISLYAEVVNSLLNIARQHPLDTTFIKSLESQTRRTAHFIYRTTNLLNSLDPQQESLLYDLLEEDIRTAKPALLRLGILDRPDTPIETIIENIRHRRKVSDNLEVLENIFVQFEREIIIPLFDDITLAEQVKIGQRLFDDLPQTLQTELSNLINNQDEWRSLLGVDYAIRQRIVPILQALEWEDLFKYHQHRTYITYQAVGAYGYVRDLPNFPKFYVPERMVYHEMYSLLEKTILLKRVSIFEHLPGREVSHIAQIAKVVTLKSGDNLFKEGDAGSTMYFITQGSLRIHTDEQEIVTYQKGATIGELAFLDGEPRSATATAIEDTVLLQIERDDFFEVMASRQDMTEGIIKMLTGRVRSTTQMLH